MGQAMTSNRLLFFKKNSKLFSFLSDKNATDKIGKCKEKKLADMANGAQ